MSLAIDRLREAWQQQGLAWKDTSSSTASAQAPGHSAKDQSVSVRQIDGQVLIHCHAGEDTAEVLDKLGLTVGDLFDNPAGIEYRYHDGRVVNRTPNKKFRQAGNTRGTALYRVETLPTDRTATVFVTEGEKDVHALESVDAIAVCGAMGAGKAKKFDWTPLEGRPVTVIADNDEPGYKHAAEVAELLSGLAASVTIVRAAAGKDAADHIAAGHPLTELVPLDYRPKGRRLNITRGTDVHPKRIRWIIREWIPAASLTLLAGREGLGKSTISARICADITRGTLEGEYFGQPRTVLYVHTEDSREHTVAPRLQAAGADMSRVLFVDVATEYSDHATLTLPTDVLALEQLVERENIGMVVLDAATSAMSAELSGRDDRDVRQFLEPLAMLAARQSTAVLGLVHFGKRDGADTGKLILGSIAWSQVARSVLSVALDEDTGKLVVTNTKTNLATRVHSQEAAIVNGTVETDDGPAEVGVCQWGEATNRDARDLLAGDPEDDDRGEIESVVFDYLETQGGSAPAGDVLKATRAAGLNDNAVKKARRKLGVKTERRGFGPGAQWVWAIDSGIDSIDSHSRARESMAPMAPMDAAKVPEESIDTPPQVRESSAPIAAPGEAGSPCAECGQTLLLDSPDGLCTRCGGRWAVGQ
ncbi:AAA family ATPase [Dietzia timorensis]|uniref:Toprim domain-containing protein n=1 Tax=Dietzia timorensis TaxID=499555 RepID=A0A173LJG3_9ACTN|nr:AAA family ATPase [Dietzia timorensis]ANI91668.1 Hypothetical protein BJL86_0874 [Dietzia timorensis]